MCLQFSIRHLIYFYASYLARIGEHVPSVLLAEKM